MTMTARLMIGASLIVAAGSTANGQWVKFENQTSSRISAPAALTTTDPDEKEYGIGDFDLDGDLDLVIVRKQPFTSPGKRVNVLLMNENGVLTDRTATYASASDVPGDQGFNTATNDRDVAVVDVDLDGWLDLVTAVTISDGSTKAIGHPRVYRNLGVDGNGDWQGFLHEDFRIPAMLTSSGNSGFNPRFCSIAAGDVTGDGYPELYFGAYDSSGAGGSVMPPGADFNNKLLINNGNGTFTDQTYSRLPTTEMWNSAFGAASIIIDMNNDGVNDVVKQTALNPPQHIAINYNNPANEGFFNAYEVIVPSSSAPYFVQVGDLNNDGLLDMVEVDDGNDFYKLNTGNGGDGLANFGGNIQFSFTNVPGGDDGFGGDAYIADLDNDGDQDVLIADVDIDIGGCGRRMHIYENQFNGAFQPTIRETVVSGASASIPTSQLIGTHDVAVFDINGDGWQDLVVGRCNSTQVWINQPPVTTDVDFVSQPTQADPNAATEVVVDVTVDGADISSVDLKYSVNGGPVQTVAMDEIGLVEGTFSASIPGMECGTITSYSVSVNLTVGSPFNTPSTNLLSAFGALVTDAGFETGAEGFAVTNAGTLTFGGWEAVNPNGSTFNGNPAAPENAATGTMAFVTGNQEAGAPAGEGDLDGGPTILTSPVLDMSGGGAVVSFNAWYFNADAGIPAEEDFLVVELSNDGGATWTQVMSIGNTTGWDSFEFQPDDFLPRTANGRVRFVANDTPNNSIAEAGIDDFHFAKIICDNGGGCEGDYTNDGVINSDDLNAVLGEFGSTFTSTDLNKVLAHFGEGC